jgi:hypothetical protein
MARAKSAARREAIITSLLVIAGIVLAICLFAAGLFWRGKPTTKRAFADGSGKPVGQITGLSGREGGSPRGSGFRASYSIVSD